MGQDASKQSIRVLPAGSDGPLETTVLAVANQKGGVGKTATAVNVAAGLANMARRTLLVDLDPQGNATSALGLPLQRLGAYELLIGMSSLGEVTVESGRERLNLMPACEDMAALELEVGGEPDRNERLRKCLAAATGAYHYVVVDCPPTLGLLTINGLIAANEVLVPVQCEYLALEGLVRFVTTLDTVSDIRGEGPLRRRYLMTMYDRRTRLSREVVQDMRGHLGDEVVRSVIPRSVRMAEAPGFGRTIFEHDPGGAAASAYRTLCKEISGATEA